MSGKNLFKKIILKRKNQGPCDGTSVSICVWKTEQN